MKRLILGAAIISLMLFGNIATSQSALIVQGDVVKDGTYVWVKDMNMFDYLTYEDQKADIQQLNDDGNSYKALGENWHMATDSEMQNLLTNDVEDIMNAFVYNGHDTDHPFNPLIRETAHLYGRYDKTADPGYHWARYMGFTDRLYGGSSGYWQKDYFNNDVDFLPDNTPYYDIGAWVVGVAPVPIGPSSILLISGLIGIFGLRKKIRK